MPRYRTIKPEFWEDEKLAQVSRDARLTFIGMWTHSDDYGVIRGNNAWLKSRIFPFDEDITRDIFSSWISSLEKIGVIIPFTQHGEKYYFIKHFSTHQKVDNPSKTRNPEPPPDIILPPEKSTLATPSLDTSETLAIPSLDTSDTLAPVVVVGVGVNNKKHIQSPTGGDGVRKNISTQPDKILPRAEKADFIPAMAGDGMPRDGTPHDFLPKNPGSPDRNISPPGGTLGAKKVKENNVEAPNPENAPGRKRRKNNQGRRPGKHTGDPLASVSLDSSEGVVTPSVQPKNAQSRPSTAPGDRVARPPGVPPDEIARHSDISHDSAESQPIGSHDIGTMSGGEINKFIFFASKTFQDKYNFPLHISRGKDEKILKTLLKTFTPEHLEYLWRFFLDIDDEFIRNAGRSIGIFSSQINKLISRQQTVGKAVASNLAEQEKYHAFLEKKIPLTEDDIIHSPLMDDVDRELYKQNKIWGEPVKIKIREAKAPLLGIPNFEEWRKDNAEYG